MKAAVSFLPLFSFLALTAMAQTPTPPPARPQPIVSPEVGEAGHATFRIRAAQAKEVTLRGQWTKDAIPMTRGEEGMWSTTVETVPPGVWEYSFSVDGLNMLDPRNPSFKPQREPQKSILHIASTPPAPWDWQDVPHGTVHQHGYLSKALGRPREVWVYTPPGYERDQATKFPLLILQHGSGDNQQTWVMHGKAHWILDNLIAQKKARPMIVAMLDGHPLGIATSREDAAKRGSPMDAFRRELLEDALPLVESVYRVEKDAAHRAIAGLSMGGSQSLTVGLGNLDKFSWVGAFSAGPPVPETAQQFLSEPEAANTKLRLLWIACGKDDFLRQRNEEFVGKLKEKNIHHEWQLTEGDHSWPVWRRYLADFAPRLFVNLR
jgi:enterochelin esterase family protein